MNINIYIFIISFFIYFTILVFVKYKYHKVSLVVPLLIVIILFLTGLVKDDSVINSIVFGFILVEVVKRLFFKIFFRVKKIKSENDQNKFMNEINDISLFDAINSFYENVNDEKDKIELEKQKELKNKEEVMDDISRRIARRKKNREK